MKTTLILTAMLVSGAAQAAPKGALDGGKFRIETVGPDKTERDTLLFDKGMLHSVSCDPYGFAPAPYKATKKGDAIEFEATIKSKTEGAIHWKGSIANGQIAGNALWT